MEQLKFTANRFKNTSVSENNNRLDKQQDDRTVDEINGLFSKKPLTVPLLDSLHYTLSNDYWRFPELEDNEYVVSFKTATDSVAIVITSSRILVYNYKSFKKRPYTFQFKYTPNNYHIPPLCAIIPNPINSSKPDLVVIDPISGVLQFLESIKLAPSLSLLQNKLQEKISLYNSEFLTDVQLFEGSCLLLTTSQKRIIYVTFKDQYGDLSINCNKIYNNRPLISFMLSKSYSIKEYSKSSHIISLKSIDVSPVMKTIIILESTGHVTFIDHIKGSSTFVPGPKADLDMLLSISNLKFMDFVFIPERKIGIFLVLNTMTNLLQNIYFDFTDVKSGPSHLFTTNVPFIPESEPTANAKMFLLDAGNSLLIQSNNRLVICNVNLNRVPHPWAEVIILNPSLQIFSVVRITPDTDVISLATDKGLILFNLKSSGQSSDVLAYVKEHLLQYLIFSKSSSPVVFSLKETLLPIIQNDVKAVLHSVLEELLDDTCSVIDADLDVDENLTKRVEVIKKLVEYISQNYEIQLDEEMRVKILNTCELLSLTKKFFHLMIDRNLVDVIVNILKELKFQGTINDFFQKNSKEILVLISHYVQVAKNVGNEIQLKDLASLLSDLFIEALIKLDDNIKRSMNGMGLSSVFIDYFDLINNVDDVTRMVYNLKLSEEEMMVNYGEILIGLCCFLYYTTNEIVAYILLHNSSNAFAGVLEKFSNLLNSHKDKWIHVFIVLKKQNDIMPLVNKYSDFESLSALLESKREIIQNLYTTKEISDIEFTNLSADIEIEFDQYFDKYNYSFAKSLFLYYIQHNKIDIMLTCFEKHSDFLDQFLSSSINYYDFAWIQDVKFQRFDKVSNAMSLYLSNGNIDPIKNKRLQTSIAKLSALCGTEDQESKSSHLSEYNSCLSLLSLQQYIYLGLERLGLFSKDYDPTRLLSTAYLVNNKFCYFPTEVQNSFQKLSSGGSLSLIEIINFISLASFFSGEPLAEPTEEMNGQTRPSKLEDLAGNRELATSEFIATLYLKLLQFSKKYVPIHSSNDGLIVAHSPYHYELEQERAVWIKVLLRRLSLRSDQQAKAIISFLETQNIKTKMKREEMILSKDELTWIAGNSPKACLDYERENELLKSSQEL